jgi:hypothetical protein
MYINPLYNFNPPQVDKVPGTVHSHLETKIECRYTQKGVEDETERVLACFLTAVRQDHNCWDASLVICLRNDLVWNVVRLLMLNGCIEMDQVPSKFILTPKGAKILSELTQKSC